MQQAVKSGPGDLRADFCGELESYASPARPPSRSTVSAASCGIVVTRCRSSRAKTPVRRRARAMRPRRDGSRACSDRLDGRNGARDASTCGAVSAGAVAQQLRQQIGVGTKFRRSEPRLVLLRQPVRTGFMRTAAMAVAQHACEQQAKSRHHPETRIDLQPLHHVVDIRRRWMSRRVRIAHGHLPRTSGVHNKSPSGRRVFDPAQTDGLGLAAAQAHPRIRGLRGSEPPPPSSTLPCWYQRQALG
jgi:hypothetical protein